MPFFNNRNVFLPHFTNIFTVMYFALSLIPDLLECICAFFTNRFYWNVFVPFLLTDLLECICAFFTNRFYWNVFLPFYRFCQGVFVNFFTNRFL